MELNTAQITSRSLYLHENDVILIVGLWSKYIYGQRSFAGHIYTLLWCHNDHLYI